MPFNPFQSVTGKNAFSLFDIRLENDFIVFRGSDHESAGQMLKGVVAICVPERTKIEDIHLRLIGQLHLHWTDTKTTPTGISTQKYEKRWSVMNHRWPSFIGTPGKSMVLEKGNYEFPFELLLDGSTPESIEGLKEGSVTYKLKATIARGKLAYDHHTYKHLRVIRTLESSALEFLHAMSVENIWPNKVEYSIVVPQKAIVFGSTIPLETRFTPLLKGLEVGEITIKLIESIEIVPSTNTGFPGREHRREREVTSWVRPVTREDHWQDMIEDTGQEGWAMTTHLDLPRKLGKCMQDVNVCGVKIRHKLKMVVSLKNPDGHVSELRATLPITIFISANIPLDEDGNLSRPEPVSPGAGATHRIAPPGYGEHLLDQLYEDVDLSGVHTPGMHSGINSPYMAASRAASNENLGMTPGDNATITPAALSSRLQDMSVDGSGLNSRDSSLLSLNSATRQGIADNHSSQTTPPASVTHSAPLTRYNSGESNGEHHGEHHGQHHGHSHSHSGHHTPEHTDYSKLSELSKVPSYSTAIRSSRVAPLSENSALPDYFTATSEPNTLAASHTPAPKPLELILETSREAEGGNSSVSPSPPPPPTTTSSSPLGVIATDTGTASGSVDESTPRTTASPTLSHGGFNSSRRQSSFGSILSACGSHSGDVDERRRLHIIQARGRVV